MSDASFFENLLKSSCSKIRNVLIRPCVTFQFVNVPPHHLLVRYAESEIFASSSIRGALLEFVQINNTFADYSTIIE
jgi:hypothetical protein